MNNLMSFVSLSRAVDEQADQPRITPWAHVVDGPPPSTLGIDGDLALDRASAVADWYERVLGTWVWRGQLQGPPGPATTTAPAGLGRLWTNEKMAPGVQFRTNTAFLLNNGTIGPAPAISPLSGGRFWEMENFGRDAIPVSRPLIFDFGEPATESFLTAFPTVTATTIPSNEPWQLYALGVLKMPKATTYTFDLILQANGSIRFGVVGQAATDKDFNVDAVDTIDVDVSGDVEPVTQQGSWTASAVADRFGIETVNFARLATDTIRVYGQFIVGASNNGEQVALFVSRGPNTNPQADDIRVGPVLLCETSKQPIDGLYPSQARAVVVAAGAEDWPDEPPCVVELVGARPTESGIVTYNDGEPSEQSALLEVVGAAWSVRVRLDTDGKLGLLLEEDGETTREAWEVSAGWSSQVEASIALRLSANAIELLNNNTVVLNLTPVSSISAITTYRFGAEEDVNTALVRPFAGRVRIARIAQEVSHTLTNGDPVLFSDAFANENADYTLWPWNGAQSWRVKKIEGLIIGGTAPKATVDVSLEDANGNAKPIGTLSLDGASPVEISIVDGFDLLATGNRERSLIARARASSGEGTIRLAVSGVQL